MFFLFSELAKIKMLIRTIEPKSLYNCVRQKSGLIFCHGFFNKKSGATTEFRFLPRKKIRGKKKSMSDLVNVFENQKIFLKKGEAIDMEGFIEQENVYKLDS